MKKVIEYRSVSKSYGEKIVLENFSLDIMEGEFLCIVGTSGSGKTTLMKMVNGIVMADEGQVIVYGEDIKTSDLVSLRRKIGYAIQGNSLFPHMNIFENITYVPKLEGETSHRLDEIVDEMLQLVQLPLNIKNKYPHQLSGGQQQRVGIARAYANKPKILLMDEPFGAVDSITRYKLQKDLKDIHKKTKCTIIFVTHDIYEAFKLATHILVMDNGKVAQYGTRDEIKNNPQSDFVKNLIEMSR